MLVDLVLSPAGPGKCRAYLGDLAITRPTRQPMFDGARALLTLGYDPMTVVRARHTGSETVAMRGVLGDLALWTVEEFGSGRFTETAVDGPFLLGGGARNSR